MMSVRWQLLGRLGVGAAAFAAVLTGLSLTGSPTATAAPVSDEHGYVDSTARCSPPSVAVAYGYTASSRVAVCKDAASGQYQYRGVRISDGARLILPAKTAGDGYVAENDGITYTVTAKALLVNAGTGQLRDEPMVDFHGTGVGAPAAPSKAAAPSTAVQPSAAPEPVTPSTPLAPPLPAEVGGR